MCFGVFLVLAGYLMGVYAVVFGCGALSGKTVRLCSFSSRTLQGRAAVYCGYACIVAGAGLIGWVTLVVTLFPEGLGH